ncbi:MAG: hypothetical protein EA400_09065 [Chromatiaceae bacterium]|nr:MAG: hypothetical protein EA400_09065 [Chromatiaceae bacterium]
MFLFPMRAVVAMAALLAGGSAWSEVPSPEPVVASMIVSEVSGEVVAIDPTRRLMTLKQADGSYLVLSVPLEVERIERIRIGNRVEATEATSMLIQVEKGTDLSGLAPRAETTVDAAPGRRPAGTIAEDLTLYGTVVAVDKAAGQVTIRGAETTRTFEVENADLLDELAPGDGVIASFRHVIRGEVRVR